VRALRGSRRTLIGLQTQIAKLPRLAQVRARRGRAAVERAAVRGLVSIIDTGTRVLRAAAGYIDDISLRVARS
jgi:hypothetical protein